MTTNPNIDLLTLAFHPVTPDRWPDLERLFGPHGANSGCWCLGGGSPAPSSIAAPPTSARPG